MNHREVFTDWIFGTAGKRVGFSHDLLTLATGPYLERWIVWLGFCTIRLHRFIGPDDRKYGLHSHPWAFLTLVFRGGYRERMQDPVTHMRSFREVGRGLHFRPADFIHAITSVHPDTWSLVITGPLKNQHWGFYDGRGGFIPHDLI